jgi:hypothetical protein
MRSNKNKRWPFTKKETSISTSRQEKHTGSAFPLFNIYRSIVDLPLYAWKRLTIDNDLKALIVDGDPPKESLLHAEYIIRMQYADAIGDGEYKMYCGVMREISNLEITLSQITSLVESLRVAYVPKFAREVNRLLQSTLVFNVNDAADYDKNLDRAIRRSKGIKLRLDLKKIELEKLEKKYEESGTGKVTHEYYQGLLITLSDEAGYQLTDEITVWDFCERIRRANKKVELQNLRGNRKRK